MSLKVVCVRVNFYKDRIPAAAVEEALNLVLGDAGEYSRVGDFVAVQVEYRENRTVVLWVEEFV